MLAIALLLPKRFSPIFITVIVVNSMFLSQTVDSFLAIRPLDLYDVGDSPKLEIMDVVLVLLCYPSVIYVFWYLYDKWQIRGWLHLCYVGGFTLLTVVLERIAVLFHEFTYNGWQLWYSCFVYVGVYTANILMFHLARHLLGNREHRT